MPMTIRSSIRIKAIGMKRESIAWDMCLPDTVVILDGSSNPQHSVLYNVSEYRSWALKVLR